MLLSPLIVFAQKKKRIFRINHQSNIATQSRVPRVRKRTHFQSISIILNCLLGFPSNKRSFCILTEYALVFRIIWVLNKICSLVSLCEYDWMEYEMMMRVGWNWKIYLYIYIFHEIALHKNICANNLNMSLMWRFIIFTKSNICCKSFEYAKVPLADCHTTDFNIVMHFQRVSRY